MSDLVQILDLYDRLVAVCGGVVSPALLEEAAETGRSARRRVGYLGESVVVALAGGTGSGKSSLLNALAGEEVSLTGAQRPTTAEPVAWIPSNPEPGLTRLLDDLGIQLRVGQDQYPWLALIDLPDTDSVVMDHRTTVDRLLPLVDAVVWVTDPEKYQDARLHRDHLQPLAASGDRFVFLLNQADRIAQEDIPTVVADLRRSLEADGIFDPTVIVTAGDPGYGPPLGLEDLIAAIKELGPASQVVERRVIDELVASADRLVAPLGGGGGTGFASRWTDARDAVAADLAVAIDDDLEREGRRTAARDARAVAALLGGRRVADEVVADAARIGSSVAQPIRELVDDVAASVDRATSVALHEVGDRIEEEVEAAAVTLGASTAVGLDEPPAWWSVVRVVLYGLGATILLGLGLVVDGLRSGESLVPGLAVAVAAAGTAVGARMALIGSASARVRAALEGRKADSVASATVELERRIGRPLRNILRSRSAPGAAHVEFALAVQRREESAQ